MNNPSADKMKNENSTKETTIEVSENNENIIQQIEISNTSDSVTAEVDDSMEYTSIEGNLTVTDKKEKQIKKVKIKMRYWTPFVISILFNIIVIIFTSKQIKINELFGLISTIDIKDFALCVYLYVFYVLFFTLDIMIYTNHSKDYAEKKKNQVNFLQRIKLSSRLFVQNTHGKILVLILILLTVKPLLSLVGYDCEIVSENFYCYYIPIKILTLISLLVLLLFSFFVTYDKKSYVKLVINISSVYLMLDFVLNYYDSTFEFNLLNTLNFVLIFTLYLYNCSNKSVQFNNLDIQSRIDSFSPNQDHVFNSLKYSFNCKNPDLKSILVNGEWGSGKTYVVDTLIAKTKQENKNHIIKINTLELETVESLQKYLMIQLKLILKSKGAYVGISSELKEFIDSTMNIINANKYSGLVNLILKNNNDYNKERQDVDNMLSEVLGDNNIILIVDDLERCSNKTFFQYLFFIKEVMNFQKIRAYFLCDYEKLLDKIIVEFNNFDQQENSFSSSSFSEITQKTSTNSNSFLYNTFNGNIREFYKVFFDKFFNLQIDLKFNKDHFYKSIKFKSLFKSEYCKDLQKRFTSLDKYLDLATMGLQLFQLTKTSIEYKEKMTDYEETINIKKNKTLINKYNTLQTQIKSKNKKSEKQIQELQNSIRVKEQELFKLFNIPFNTATLNYKDFSQRYKGNESKITTLRTKIEKLTSNEEGIPPVEINGEILKRKEDSDALYIFINKFKQYIQNPRNIKKLQIKFNFDIDYMKESSAIDFSDEHVMELCNSFDVHLIIFILNYIKYNDSKEYDLLCESALDNSRKGPWNSNTCILLRIFSKDNIVLSDTHDNIINKLIDAYINDQTKFNKLLLEYSFQIKQKSIKIAIEKTKHL